MWRRVLLLSTLLVADSAPVEFTLGGVGESSQLNFFPSPAASPGTATTYSFAHSVSPAATASSVLELSYVSDGADAGAKLIAFTQAAAGGGGSTGAAGSGHGVPTTATSATTAAETATTAPPAPAAATAATAAAEALLAEGAMLQYNSQHSAYHFPRRERMRTDSRASAAQGGDDDDFVISFLEVDSQVTVRDTPVVTTAIFPPVNLTGSLFVAAPEQNLIGIGSLKPPRQWRLHLLETFDVSPVGWVSKATGALTRGESCGNPANLFLGRVGGTDKEVSKTFTGLPPHTGLRLRALFHFIDEWKGEYGYIQVDGVTVWQQNHRHCLEIFAEMCKGINVCGDEKFADQLSTLVDVEVPQHSKESITVTLGSSLVSTRFQASFGVDDLQLFIR